MPLLPEPPTIESLRAKLGEPYPWVVLFVISGGGIASILTSTSFTVAIPTLMARFNLGHDVVQLTMSAYMAAMTIAMLPAAWLFDRFGLRRCFLFSMIFMLVVSALGAFSTSFGFMVAIRAAQGAAAGMMGPMGTIAVMRLFPQEAQGRAYGVIGFVIVLAPAIAPSIGGFLVDAYGWQSIFWMNVPFCILALIAGLYLLPLVPRRTHEGPDWIGLVLLAIATLALIVAATLLHSAGLLSWQVLLPALIGILAVSVFLRHARRIDNPIISPAIFRYPRIAMGSIVAIVYGAGLYGSTYLVPLFLQTILGFSAHHAGVALLPAGMALAVSLLLGGWWVDRSSPRLLNMLGLLIFGFAFLLLWHFAPNAGYMTVVAATVLSRIGLGIQQPALNMGALRGLEGREMGQATVVINYLRQLGGMLGIASLAVFVEWRSHQPGVVGNTAFAEGFLMIAIAFGIALLAARNMHDEPR